MRHALDIAIAGCGLGALLAWFLLALFSGFETTSALLPANFPYANDGTLSCAPAVFIAACSATLAVVPFIHPLKHNKRGGIISSIVFGVVAALATVCFVMGKYQSIEGVVIGSALVMGAAHAMLLAPWGERFVRMNTVETLVAASLGVLIAFLLFALAVVTMFMPVSPVELPLLPLVSVGLLVWTNMYSRQESRPSKLPRGKELIKILPDHPSKDAQRSMYGLISRLCVASFGMGVMLCSLRAFILHILPYADGASMLTAAAIGFATTLLVPLGFRWLEKGRSWTFLFRPTTPLAAILICAAFLLHEAYPAIAGGMLVVALFCFESIAWSFFADLSRRFGINASTLFCLGYSALMLGSLPMILPLDPPLLSLSFGIDRLAIATLLIIILMYVSLPREHEIRAALGMSPDQIAEDVRPDRKQQSAGKGAAGNGKQGEGARQQGEASPKAQSGETTAEGQRGETASEGQPGQAGAKAQPGKSPLSALSAETTDESADELSDAYAEHCQWMAQHFALSRREIDVLELLARGHSLAAIQKRLYISQGTAKTHTSHIYRKLDVHSQQQLIDLFEETREMRARGEL